MGRQFLNTRKLSLFSLLHSIKLSRNMAPSTINILLTSFPGLNLPATLALPLPAETSISELQERIHERLPAHKNRLILTTISNRQLPVISEEPISGLLSKPEMAKKEKEERRKRWEQIVELAERREEEMRSGNKGKVDGKWVEDKEEANERTREAVLAAMKSGDYRDNLIEAAKASLSGSADSESDDEAMAGTSSKDTTPPSESAAKPKAQKFFSFDEDDEFMSSDEDEDEEKKEDIQEEMEEDEESEEEVEKEPTPPPAPAKGKGKGKAKAPIKAKPRGKGRVTKA